MAICGYELIASARGTIYFRIGYLFVRLMAGFGYLFVRVLRFVKKSLVGFKPGYLFVRAFNPGKFVHK